MKSGGILGGMPIRRCKLYGSGGGFTLVEILITLSITAFLAGLTLTYSKIGERQIALSVEAQKIASIIFRAKSITFTGSGAAVANWCGYGVIVNYAAGTYSIFAYQEPTLPNCTMLTSVPSGFRVALSTFTLNQNVVFKNTNPDSMSLVLFIPPDPKTLLSLDDGTSLVTQPLKIYLETKDGLAKRTITVNSSGQIDF